MHEPDLATLPTHRNMQRLNLPSRLALRDVWDLFEYTRGFS